MAFLYGRRMFLLSTSSRVLLSPSSRNNVYTHCIQERAWAVQEMESRRFLRIRAQSVSTTAATSSTLKPTTDTPFSSLSPLERLRSRQLRDVTKPVPGKSSGQKGSSAKGPPLAVSFEELGLSEEVMAAVRELGISKPTEVQSLGIPSVLAGESVVMASHTGSGKTLAYMLPIIQALRRDEAESGKATRIRRPRCVVLCPTRELAEQVARKLKIAELYIPSVE